MKRSPSSVSKKVTVKPIKLLPDEALFIGFTVPDNILPYSKYDLIESTDNV